MLINEVVDPMAQKLVALASYILGQADTSGTSKKISIDRFIDLAQDMDVNITDGQLRDLATQPPLNKLIVNVTGDEVIFAGAGESTKVTDTMTVTQAQDTVAKMADRAMPADLK